jgi:hypothetical protein
VPRHDQSILRLMNKHLRPQKAFPDEVLAFERDHGIPLPDFFAGPLYTGNGTVEAVKDLQAARDAASASPPGGDGQPSKP